MTSLRVAILLLITGIARREAPLLSWNEGTMKQSMLAFVEKEQHIGRRPIFAAGNSDGDFQMLEWTTSGKSPRSAIIIHHTNAEREFAYQPVRPSPPFIPPIAASISGFSSFITDREPIRFP